MTVNETGEYGTSGGARDAGRKIGEEMKAGAREAVEVGKERTRSFLEDQKATVAGQMEDLATMLRRAAREHDEDGGRGASARLAERAADGMESIGRQRLLGIVDHGQAGGALLIDLDPLLKLVGQLSIVVNGLHGTLRYASTAVDALLGIDVEHVFVGVKAVDGAHRHTVGEAALAAVVGNDEGHEIGFLL
jgi:hypothetical protein